jgi:hypothetical protein
VNLTDPVSISVDVVAREVGGETMLLDLESGTYFGLDEVGACVWRAIEDGRTPAEACEAIIAAYDVERDVAERDLAGLLGQLLEKGLIAAA